MVRNLAALWETWVQSLGWKDSLEKGMATHSNILAWIISWPEEPGGLQSMGSQRVRLDWVIFTFSKVCTKGSFISWGYTTDNIILIFKVVVYVLSYWVVSMVQPVGYIDPGLFDESTQYLLQSLTLPDFLTSWRIDGFNIIWLM